MKKLLLALALFAGPASAKVWVDETCQVMLQSAPGKPFIFSTTDGTKEVSCTVRDWPISEETATMTCSDGSSPTMRLVESSVEFDGLMLRPRGDKAVLCD